MGVTIQVHVDGAGGGSPTGNAGGSLDGTYPNPGIAEDAISEREIKELTGGTDGQFVASDGLGKFKYLDSALTKIEQVFSGSSFVDQEPVALNTPIKIKFGAAQSNTYFSLDVNGKLTCLKAGAYIIRRAVQFGRNGAAGISNLVGRILLNGVQSGDSSYGELDNANVTIPSSGFGVLDLSVNDEIEFELVRDFGNNSGGLLAYLPTTGGWSDAPSASLAAYLITGSAVPVPTDATIIEGFSSDIAGDLIGNTSFIKTVSAVGAVVGDKVSCGISDILYDSMNGSSQDDNVKAKVVSADNVEITFRCESFVGATAGWKLWFRIVK